MSNCSGNSSSCCALILKQYPALSEAITECRPGEPELLQTLMAMLYLTLNPLYQRVKCGSIQCCDGLVSSIFCAFTTFLSGSDNEIADLQAILTGILSLYGFPDPFGPIFEFTGTTRSIVIPAGVTSIIYEVLGAQGGDGSLIDSLGGSATGTYLVNPGDVLYINVGGQGGLPVGLTGGAGGFNGGGAAGNGTLEGGYGGGGASDIRLNGTALTDRIIVAGGGGGRGDGRFGGSGGGVTGDAGQGSASIRGGGGTNAVGGTGGVTSPPGANGALGLGGAGGGNTEERGGSGGGGGYYGGGGASGTTLSVAPGAGGGSGFGSGATLVNGVRAGNGRVTITYVL